MNTRSKLDSLTDAALMSRRKLNKFVEESLGKQLLSGCSDEIRTHCQRSQQVTALDHLQH